MSVSWNATRVFTWLATFLIVGMMAPAANAQLLYSFETGLDGWGPESGSDSDYIAHDQSIIGVTEGTMALEIETGSGFGRDVVVNEGSGPIYDIFNTVAADPSLYTFDFDVTFTNDSWSSLTSVGGWFEIGVSSNSDNGFADQFGVGNGTPGSASSFTASMPASQISLAPNSSFYQLSFITNSNHTNGPGGEGVLYYLDNLRFSLILQFQEKLLFSWETPDDVGTPAVNEQLEGWIDGFSGESYQHTRSITTDGATQGSSALQIDSQVPPIVIGDEGFAWGSQFVLDSGGTGDPANQTLIDTLIADVNGADRIAFDVTFPDDQLFNAPTFLSLFVSVSDQNSFFKSPAKQAGNPIDQAGETITIEIPLSEMTEITDGSMNLADDGLTPGTFFRIALATNSDDANFFSIDNFRLLTELTELNGDYNNDGVVDAADYTVWRDNEGAAAGTLLNDTDGGVIGAAQYTTWASNFGEVASSAIAVPEPGTGVILLLSLVSLGLRRRS